MAWGLPHAETAEHVLVTVIRPVAVLVGLVDLAILMVAVGKWHNHLAKVKDLVQLIAPT